MISSPTDLPAVSVVMGVYNNADCLSETLDSVLSQTETDWELIVVNDGSTEARVQGILEDYAARDSRIRILRRKNEGVTRALITGCALARGRYIARIDVGDTMLPDRLQQQRAVLDARPEAVLATCWTECCGPEWEPLYAVRTTEPSVGLGARRVGPLFVDAIGQGGPTHHGSVLFRSETYRLTGGYRPQFYYGQDWDLWYRLSERGGFVGVQKVLYRCRIFPGGLSMQNHECQGQVHACSRRAFLARQKGEDESPFVERAASIRPAAKPLAGPPSNRSLAAGCYFIGEALRRNGDRRCGKYFRQGLVGSPGSLKLWLRWFQSFLLKAEPEARQE